MQKSKNFKIRNFLISLIHLYQRILSPDKGILKRKNQTCVFYPTCSDYSISVIEKYGSFFGLIKSVRRILRCHPWQKNRIDYVK